MEKEPIDLEALLQYCIALLQHKADAKHQKIELQAKPVVMNCSRERMWRVISNLVGNAIKFSPEGETISVALKQEANQILISVQDRGIGIPSNMQDRVFDLFTDAKRKGTAGEPSHGLGLAVSKQIVEAHGGKIWLDSEPGRGTAFHITFSPNVIAESRA
jgi:signal transduction histidine kinase